MRAALAGQSPAALPGVGEPGWFGAPFAAPAAAPSPPAEVSSQSPNRNESGGLDVWLLDKLFGRR
jgi:hypothetical protein